MAFFALQSEWQEIRLGDYIEVVRGASPRPKGDPKYFGGEINWVSIKDVNAEKGKYLSITREFVTPAGAEKSRLLPIGSLILSNSASVCIPKILKKEGCIHDGFVTFPNIDRYLSIDYFYHLFNWMRPSVIQENKQGVTQVNLNTAIIRNFRLPIPPLAEQKVIADKLDTLLAQVETTKARLDRIPQILKRFRQSVLAAAVSGRLTEEIEPWQSKTLEECFECIDGDRGPNYPKKHEYLNSGYCLFLSTKNVRPFGFDFTEQVFISREKDEVLRKGRLMRGDLMITTRGTLGHVASYDESVPFDVVRINSGMLILRKKQAGFFNDYFKILIASPVFQKYIENQSTGSAQPQLPAKILKGFILPVPSAKEQVEIAQQVGQLFAHADRIEQQVQAAQERVNNLTQSILAKAFRGELTEQWRKDNPELISGENSAAALLERIQAERATNNKARKTTRPAKKPS